MKRKLATALLLAVCVLLGACTPTPAEKTPAGDESGLEASSSPESEPDGGGSPPPERVPDGHGDLPPPPLPPLTDPVLAMDIWAVLPTLAYTYVWQYENGLAQVWTDNGYPHTRYGYIDTEGREVIPLSDRSISYFSEGLLAVQRGDKWGYEDTEGRVAIPHNFAYAGPFTGGLAPVSDENWLWGFIDKTGKEVVPCIYENVQWYFSEGLAAAQKDGKWGFIDESGRVVIGFIYDQVETDHGSGMHGFRDGLALVGYGIQADGSALWGYIDQTGREVVPCKYTMLGAFSEEGLAPAWTGDWETGVWCGVVDRAGREVTPFRYNWVYPFREGRALAGIGDWENGFRYGYIDTEGREIIPLIYHDAQSYFTEGLAVVRMDGRYGVIDLSGRTVIPFVYDGVHMGEYAGEISGFSEGVLTVMQDGKYGAVDRKGNVLAPCIYDYADGYFISGLMGVRKGNNWPDYTYGLIDTAGREVIPCEYLGINHYYGGSLIGVQKNDLLGWGYFDREGRQVTPFLFEETRGFNEGLAFVKYKGKWGVLSLEKLLKVNFS